MKSYNKNSESRNKIVAKIKIAQKNLSMDDETYREMLRSETGKQSCTELSFAELNKVINRFISLGFNPNSKNKPVVKTHAPYNQDLLIRNMWLDLHAKCKVHDPSERALMSWAKGQMKSKDGIDALQWLSVFQKQRLIEQLKMWLAR